MIRIPSYAGTIGDASFQACPEGQRSGIDWDAPPRPGKDLFEQRMACLPDWCGPERPTEINVRYDAQGWCMKPADVDKGLTPCQAGMGTGNKACIDNTNRNLIIGAGVVAAGVAIALWRPWK